MNIAVLQNQLTLILAIMFIVCQVLYLVSFLAMVYLHTRPINWVDPLEAQDLKPYELPKIILFYPVLRELEETMRTTFLGLQKLKYPKDKYAVIAIPNTNDTVTVESLQRLQKEFSFLEVLPVPPTTDKSWDVVWKEWNANPKAYWWHQGKYRNVTDLPPKKTRQLIYAFYRMVNQLGDNWLLDYIDADSVPPPDHFLAAAAGIQKYDVLQSTNVAGNLLDSWPASWHSMDHMVWDGLVYPHLSANGRHPFWVLGKGLFYKASDLVEVGGFHPWVTIEDPEVGMRLWANGKRIGIIANPLIEEVPLTLKRGIIQRYRWVCGFFQSLNSPLTLMGMSFHDRMLARLNLVPSLFLTVNIIGLPTGFWALAEWIKHTSPLSSLWFGVAVTNITLYIVIMSYIYISTWRRTSLVLKSRKDRLRYMFRVNPIALWIYWLIWTIPIVIGIKMFLRDQGKEWLRTEKIDANHTLVRVIIQEKSHR